MKSLKMLFAMVVLAGIAVSCAPRNMDTYTKPANLGESPLVTGVGYPAYKFYEQIKKGMTVQQVSDAARQAGMHPIDYYLRGFSDDHITSTTVLSGETVNQSWVSVTTARDWDYFNVNFPIMNRWQNVAQFVNTYYNMDGKVIKKDIVVYKIPGKRNKNNFYDEESIYIRGDGDLPVHKYKINGLPGQDTIDSVKDSAFIEIKQLAKLKKGMPLEEVRQIMRRGITRDDLKDEKTDSKREKYKFTIKDIGRVSSWKAYETVEIETVFDDKNNLSCFKIFSNVGLDCKNMGTQYCSERRKSLVPLYYTQALEYLNNHRKRGSGQYATIFYFSKKQKSETFNAEKAERRAKKAKFDKKKRDSFMALYNDHFHWTIYIDQDVQRQVLNLQTKKNVLEYMGVNKTIYDGPGLFMLTGPYNATLNRDRKEYGMYRLAALAESMPQAQDDLKDSKLSSILQKAKAKEKSGGLLLTANDKDVVNLKECGKVNEKLLAEIKASRALGTGGVSFEPQTWHQWVCMKQSDLRARGRHTGVPAYIPNMNKMSQADRSRMIDEMFALQMQYRANDLDINGVPSRLLSGPSGVGGVATDMTAYPVGIKINITVFNGPSGITFALLTGNYGRLSRKPLLLRYLPNEEAAEDYFVTLEQKDREYYAAHGHPEMLTQ